MSRYSEGSKLKHQKLLGYIVYGSGGVLTACHGDAPGRVKLLYGHPITIFPTRRAAENAIEQTIEQDPEHGRSLSVLRAAALAEADGRGR